MFQLSTKKSAKLIQKNIKNTTSNIKTINKIKLNLLKQLNE